MGWTDNLPALRGWVNKAIAAAITSLEERIKFKMGNAIDAAKAVLGKAISDLAATTGTGLTSVTVSLAAIEADAKRMADTLAAGGSVSAQELLDFAASVNAQGTAVQGIVDALKKTETNVDDAADKSVGQDDQPAPVG